MGAALPAGSAATPTPRRADSMRGLSLHLFLTALSCPDLSRVFWVIFVLCECVGGGVWVARSDVAAVVTPSPQPQRSAAGLGAGFGGWTGMSGW